MDLIEDPLVNTEISLMPYLLLNISYQSVKGFIADLFFLLARFTT